MEKIKADFDKKNKGKKNKVKRKKEAPLETVALE
jgi:hypothetical protein